MLQPGGEWVAGLESGGRETLRETVTGSPMADNCVVELGLPWWIRVDFG